MALIDLKSDLSKFRTSNPTPRTLLPTDSNLDIDTMPAKFSPAEKYTPSMLNSYSYDKSFPTKNSNFDQGIVSITNQVGTGTTFRYSDQANIRYANQSTVFSVGNTFNNTYRPTDTLESNLLNVALSKNAIDLQYKKFNLTSDEHNIYNSYLNQPYILRGIQRKGNETPQRWGFGIGFDDGLIRGGAVTMADRIAADTVRIAKFMASPKGLLWIVKQVGLGLTNPKVEAKGSGLTSRPTRIHTGVASLLSVAGTGLGLHFTRHGIPFANEYGSYENVKRAQSKENSRMYKLRSELISPDATGAGGLLGSIQALSNTVKNFNGQVIQELSGLAGPNSVYGIGATTIRRYTDTTGLETSKTLGNKANYTEGTGIKSYATLAYGQIPTEKTKRPTYGDFRELIKDNTTGYETGYYTKNNLETKYGFKGIGKAGNAANKDYTATGKDSFIIKGKDFTGNSRKILIEKNTFRGDAINALDIGDANANEVYGSNANDFIKFYFEDGEQSKNVMVFRATLTGFSDSFSPGWDKIDIMGRPEGAYIYSSFERTVTFNFMVAALSRSEMIPMWRKLNYLASYTMPDYESQRPSGPFMRITVGDLFQQTPGFISSLSYTIPDDATWDIADDSIDNPDAKQLPMLVDVAMTFTVVGDYKPQKMGRVYSLSPLGDKDKIEGQWLADAKTK